MRKLILFALPLSFLILSCEQTNNSFEIGISDVLHFKTPFTNENCDSDNYLNIFIKNDTLLVLGTLQNEFGNFRGVLKQKESEHLYDLIKKINPNNRKEKDINPTTGMTALIIKENGKVIDSLVDLKVEWNQSDLDLFDYIGDLICSKKLIKTSDTIFYPTWEMVKPPE